MKDQLDREKTYFEATPRIPTVEAYKITTLTGLRSIDGEGVRRLMDDGSRFDVLHGRTDKGEPDSALWYPYDDTWTRVLDKRQVAYGRVVTAEHGITLHVGDWIVFGEDTIEFHDQGQFERRFATN